MGNKRMNESVLLMLYNRLTMNIDMYGGGGLAYIILRLARDILVIINVCSINL